MDYTMEQFHNAFGEVVDRQSQLLRCSWLSGWFHKNTNNINSQDDVKGITPKSTLLAIEYISFFFFWPKNTSHLFFVLIQIQPKDMSTFVPYSIEYLLTKPTYICRINAQKDKVDMQKKKN